MSTNEGRFSGKVALVTGASRGMGAEIAKKLAAGGAEFIGVHYGSNRDAALKVVEEIKALGSKAVALEADLNTGITGAKKLWASFEDAVRSEIGSVHLDILINNAGIAPAVSFEETSIETFEDVININLKAPYFLTQEASPFIRNGGRIINMSTGFTRVAGPMNTIYAASKGAIETLTLALAPHFASKGITVNAVRPGVTDTDMNKDWLANPEARAGAASASVFGRVGNVKDVADVVVFVASEEARWVTGQFIDATGGNHL
ncbi:NAD(P)-dependent dehydrogenase (short-subunit alcohol dehydrogenase family) [Paenibacillus rhizosphaerae]|uniref:NAD(P)-dependent dehydrogenase (Short-subunit alcohol dehydrogenase family) n=1 Tax=Paenibacillus rhizosphaerae TaxID=297318 RepID=A0A839TI21_9BACL|nr:SDR family oxidoreductase [Paenibacillus rhizosphaerae]MBB3125400.1 NAD(P)-dependent dehydrogenase (short-subunit alcohol dehydrogenase family) [Paenibacillus rhizosphaerae]